MTDKSENRGGARIAASFWTGVEGVDDQPVFRRGNLSATGVYFQVGESAGASGSVQFLHLESEDRQVAVQLLARVIRVTEIDDITAGKIIGLAFEFMPSSAEGRRSLDRLVRHVVELGLRNKAMVEHNFDVEVSGDHHADRTTLERLSVQKLVLETDWKAEVGESLAFEIRSSAAGSQVPLNGVVTGVTPATTGYRVEVRVTGVSTGEAATHTNEVAALTQLVSETLDDFALPPRNDLSGSLARVKLPVLLGLMELERMSGKIVLTPPTGDEAVLYLSEGRLVRATCGPWTGSIGDLLGLLLKWQDGLFHFEIAPIDCGDSAGHSITSLLLNSARIEDEANEDVEITPGDQPF